MSPPRLLRPDELRAGVDLFRQALLQPPMEDAQWERVAGEFTPDRSWGVSEGDRLIATARSFPTRTGVPGGAVLDVAAVTQVGVRADRTRRGLMTAVMRAVLDAAAEQGDVLAALHATEARIYGRFGYGVATRCRSVRVKRGHGIRPTVPVGEIRLLDRDEIVAVLSRLHDTLALRRPGGIERAGVWWERAVARRLRDGATVLAAVHTGPDGDDGFALASVDSGDALHLDDLQAADASATATLWRFLLDVDLVTEVTARLRPVDEPLDLLLADPRDLTVTAVEDELWLRLVDVPTALAARSYGAAESVLLAVHDPFLEANAGVYRIAGGTAERVEPLGGPVKPELECDAAALAMVYLGDRRPSELAATGWWTSHDPAALARADAAFATPVVPWCGTMF